MLDIFKSFTGLAASGRHAFNMRVFSFVLCLGLTILPVCAQPAKKPAAVPKPTVKKPVVAGSTQPKKPVAKAVDDKKEFDAASTIEDPAQKIAALKKFIAKFSESALSGQAHQLLSATYYAVADQKFAAGDTAGAIENYKLAVNSAPTPVPSDLFNDSLSKIPNALYWRGERPSAIDIAKALESQVGANADQLAALAMFYVGTENGDEAVRLAEAAVKADPSKSRSYGVLGLANRVDFKLDDSASAYAKALELDPNSISLKRNLAEIRRATGKADDAVALYREAVAADANDLLSQNGLVLSLFDAGKVEEAEKALVSSLEQNPNNVMLMAGAAYWYAAHKMDEKAIDLARRAISVEPRYVWSHIALGRALMLQNRPTEAEEALLKARAYGNFPTLEYEIASARAMAGFYRDAVEGLDKAFTLDGDSVRTRIGGRVERKGSSFSDILSDERRASILEPAAADDADTAGRLKQLLALNAAMAAAKPDDAAIAKTADAFVAGDDNSKYHRQLYVASLLLNKKTAIDKALELAEAAVGNSDAALNMPNAGSFVMASELYESRQLALSRNEYIKIPDVPRPMLAAILRGRIEDLIGWALVAQNKPADAIVHFKRSVTILPDKSAWWRASMWRFGTALQADGKEALALDAYIKSYAIDKPDAIRYTTIEALYRKLNGSTEGLEAKIGPNPVPTSDVASKSETDVVPTALPAVTATPNIAAALPASTPAAASPEPSPAIIPAKTEIQDARPVTTNENKSGDVKVVPAPVSPETEPSVKPEQPASKTVTNSEIEAKPTPEVVPAPTPTPEAAASPTPEVLPTVSPTPVIEKVVNIEPAGKTETLPSPSPSPSPIEAATSPTPESKPVPEPVPTTTPEIQTTKAESSPSPTPETTQTPQPEIVAKSEPPAIEPQPSPISAASDGTAKRVKTELVVTSTIPLTTGPPVPEKRPEVQTSRKETLDKPPQPKTSASPKPLFEPVVITIPKSDAASSSERSGQDQTKREPDARARLIEGQPVQTDAPAPCEISVNQERLSLLNNGGTLAILIGLEKGQTLADLKYVVSDPEDISVKFEPDVTEVQGRALYIVSSISERTGTFRVTFYLPCGKRDVSVTVR